MTPNTLIKALNNSKINTNDTKIHTQNKIHHVFSLVLPNLVFDGFIWIFIVGL